MGNRHFWERKYYVYFVGNVNEEKISSNISEPEEESKLVDRRI